MRILRVAQKVYPESVGGGQYHVHAMSRDQASAGHDVTVLTTTSRRTSRIRERSGYEVVEVPKGLSIASNDISPSVARYLLRSSSEFDLIHAHSHLYFSTNLAALTRRFGDSPLVVTNHGLYSQSVSEWIFRTYLYSIGRWTFNQADTVFCYSSAEKERLRDIGVKSPIDVVHNGIDVSRFSPSGSARDEIGNRDLTLLFVGRLVQGKRPALAVEALSAALEKYSSLDAELAVVGDGPGRETVQRVANREGITERVSLHGAIPYDEMPAVYRAADLLLLPSRSEGVPRAVLESLASAVPVVTSPLPQLQQLCAVGGRQPDQAEPRGFAEAIRELADDNVRHTLGRSGREYVSTHHDWNETVETTTNRLQGLVKGS
ncbi:glycosyltransferase family 4 protein [Halomicroarcula sp. GCM10025709]|uniref:glycosyltransferase family 4 protein n=1 Tax=Haloarcula TaxID=2237 RepID=UPI0024C34EC7|nr:glycosyltransferase family 4 protein [Halomicroarcula sp. YJ-61-S]